MFLYHFRIIVNDGKSKINIDKKPFKILLLTCHNIISTIPRTIKGLYPVRELSIKLNWIDDINITSNGFFNIQNINGYPYLTKNINTQIIFINKKKRLNSSTTSFSTQFFTNINHALFGYQPPTLILNIQVRTNFYSNTTFYNHPLQKVSFK